MWRECWLTPFGSEWVKQHYPGRYEAGHFKHARLEFEMSDIHSYWLFIKVRSANTAQDPGGYAILPVRIHPVAFAHRLWVTPTGCSVRDNYVRLREQYAVWKGIGRPGESSTD